MGKIVRVLFTIRCLFKIILWNVLSPQQISDQLLSGSVGDVIALQEKFYLCAHLLLSALLQLFPV